MKMDKMVVPLLTGVAALNWGLAEFVGFNAVEALSFGVGAISMALYAAVTVAGGFQLYKLFR